MVEHHKRAAATARPETVLTEGLDDRAAVRRTIAQVPVVVIRDNEGVKRLRDGRPGLDRRSEQAAHLVIGLVFPHLFCQDIDEVPDRSAEDEAVGVDLIHDVVRVDPVGLELADGVAAVEEAGRDDGVAGSVWTPHPRCPRHRAVKLSERRL